MGILLPVAGIMSVKHNLRHGRHQSGYGDCFGTALLCGFHLLEVSEECFILQCANCTNVTCILWDDAMQLYLGFNSLYKAFKHLKWYWCHMMSIGGGMLRSQLLTIGNSWDLGDISLESIHWFPFRPKPYTSGESSDKSLLHHENFVSHFFFHF